SAAGPAGRCAAAGADRSASACALSFPPLPEHADSIEAATAPMTTNAQIRTPLQERTESV
ncbi:MAG: hypothetical protein ACXVIM_13435, partial [Acidimicrobiia bacterium]